MLQHTGRFAIVIWSKKKIPEIIVNHYNRNYHTERKRSCNGKKRNKNSKTRNNVYATFQLRLFVCYGPHSSEPTAIRGVCCLLAAKLKKKKNIDQSWIKDRVLRSWRSRPLTCWSQASLCSLLKIGLYQCSLWSRVIIWLSKWILMTKTTSSEVILITVQIYCSPHFSSIMLSFFFPPLTFRRLTSTIVDVPQR